MWSQGLSTNQPSGGAGTAADLARWDAQLRAADATSVVLSSAPTDPLGRAELEIALRAGVPVAIWDRRGRTSPETGELIRNLMNCPPSDVVRRLRRLRAEAATALEPHKHPGRHLAILWDDPTRQVPVQQEDS
jgi:vWA-MoxR associated protein C-terminal domain